MDITFDTFMQTEVPRDTLIISRTDLSGKITYANEIFASISGYDADELIGKAHSIVRHPDMPKSVFKELWDTIKSGNIWKGYVKNQRKDKGYYWVYAEVSGVYKNNELVEYKSIRVPMSEALKSEYQSKYDKLKRDEESIVRVVTILSLSIVKKIENYAKEKGVGEDKIINDILEDSLL